MKIIHELPAGYRWLESKGLISYEPFSTFEPWYFLKQEGWFLIRKLNQNDQTIGSKTKIVAFARRQDNDEFACFLVKEGTPIRILVVKGWASHGFEFIQEMNTFWDWIKSVLDDIEFTFEAET